MRFSYKSLVVAALSSSKRNNTPITDRAGRKRFLTGWSTKYTTTPYLAHGLNDRGHDWYFGYLVCAYTQVYFGIKTLLNYQSVTQEIFQYCFQQEN